MKKTLLIGAAVLSLATVAWMQVNPSAPRPLSSLMPAGPMIYLEAKDFNSLLNEWNRSGVKRAWLSSANYQVFSNSLLLQKLDGLYREYGVVAGFLPGLPGVLEIAGRESALGLYDLREQQFVYITRVPESQLTRSQLWRLREKFTQRQAAGIPFYIRRDDASNRTVVFAFTGGWLVLATRDDLMSNTLALIASPAAAGSSVQNEPWLQSAVAQAGAPGELRIALNMRLLLADVRFRSYWIQRNVSDLRPFAAGIADVDRSRNEIAERRIFTRAPESEIVAPSTNALDSLAALRALAPPSTVLVKAWAAPSPAMVQSLVESKLLAPPVEQGMPMEYAPGAASTDQIAGSEQDLETRIDEPPLPVDVSGALQSAALRDLIAQASPDAVLQIQSSANAGRFVRTPSVLVLAAPSDWDPARVREAISSAVETLWTTSRLGVEWKPAALGQHAIEQLDGMAALAFSINGKLLFLANDTALLRTVLDRIGTAPVPPGPAYAAEFRHAQNEADYLRIMRALDFGGRPQSFLYNPQGDRTPPFFSGNLASLGSALGFVQTMAVTVTESPAAQRQIVVYR